MRSWQVGINRAVELLFRPRMWDLLSNTLTMMAGVTLISIVLGIACALLFQRYRFFGKTIFQTAITLPLCIPAFVSCFTWISLTFRVNAFGDSDDYEPVLVPARLPARRGGTQTHQPVLRRSQPVLEQKPPANLFSAILPSSNPPSAAACY